jgi:CHASE1-domain containing sensor protein
MKEPKLKKELYIVLISLMIFLTFNFVLHEMTNIRMVNQSKRSFEEVNLDIKHLIENKITQYTDTLRYGKKLFESSDSVTRDDFASFFMDMFGDQRKTNEAIDLIAYVEKVQNKKEYVNKIRAEKTKTPFQFLYFNLTTLENNSEGYIFNYIIPHTSGSRYFGYDASEQVELKKAFLQSGNEDKVVLTSAINLFGKEEMFLIQPIYGKKSSDSKLATSANMVSGYIVLALNPSMLFDNIFAYQEVSKSTNIQLFFSDKDTEPFYSESNVNLTKEQEKLQGSSSLKFGDKKIILHVDALPSMELSLFERVFPEIVFFGSSFMVLGFFFVMINYRMSCDERPKE